MSTRTQTPAGPSPAAPRAAWALLLVGLAAGATAAEPARAAAASAGAASLPAPYFGAVLTLALCQLLFYAATRQAAAALHAHALGWLLLWGLLSGDAAAHVLGPAVARLRAEGLAVAAAGAFAAIGLLAAAHLQTHITLRRPWRAALGVLIGLNLCPLLLALAGQAPLATAAGLIIGLVLVLYTVGVATWLMLQGHPPARHYLAACGVFGGGVAARAAQLAGLLPEHPLTHWGVPLGAALAALVLTYGLLASHEAQRNARLLAERRERKSQQALASELEGEVAERTRALDVASRRLQQLAITDELTGAFNRRHFNEFCVQVFEHQTRDEPLAFCIFDLDHFKAFNDLLGDEAGDQVLRAVAGAVRAELRRSGDLLFRLGGEQFGLLFTANTPENAQRFVERLRQAIRELRIHHPGSASGIVTASFGVAWWGLPGSRGLTRDALYAQADGLLHGAKASGRDRVEVLAL